MKKKQQSFINEAFTLAEVLITLMVIGILAMVTLPGLTQSWELAVVKTSYKNAYRDINQAFLMALNNGEITNAKTQSDIAFFDNYKAMMSYLRVVKTCNKNNYDECWVCNTSDNTVKPFTGCWKSQTNTMINIDSQGRAWWNVYPGQSFIEVDTNGLKKPNEIGRDRFVFATKGNDGNRWDTNYTIVKPYFECDMTPSVDCISGYGTYDWCPSKTCLYKSWLGL